MDFVLGTLYSLILWASNAMSLKINVWPYLEPQAVTYIWNFKGKTNRYG